MKKLLPIGSVVLLKGAAKRIMICGRLQQRVGDEKVYDYCACYYPEGILDPKEMFLFNNEDIERLYYVGMQDPEEFNFQRALQEKMAGAGSEPEAPREDG